MQAFQALRSLFRAFLELFGLLDNSILPPRATPVRKRPTHRARPARRPTRARAEARTRAGAGAGAAAGWSQTRSAQFSVARSRLDFGGFGGSGAALGTLEVIRSR